MVYKHILNIEEVTYVSNFQINIFYFMSTLLYKYIPLLLVISIILYLKVIYVLKSTLLLVISKIIFLLVLF